MFVFELFRFRYLLDLYQEQPSLLDPFMEIMINRVWLSFLIIFFYFLVSVCLIDIIVQNLKTKIFMVLKMKYMEKVLSSLERYSDSVMDMDSRYILLLWTVILCKNPFDLSKFETKNGCNVLERMITVALPYLYLNTDRYLLLITDQVLKALHRLSNLEDSDFTVKKLTVKIVQRLGMVFLKPKVSIYLQIFSVSFIFSYMVLNTILESLRDRHTDIRWAGAKGIGRILSRLPKHLASDVLCNIIKFNFNLHSGNAAWHGGCLAVAELARRGFLPLERLPDIMKILLIALVFEEPQGHHALGASVRDAACYICWSLARTFHPMDLEAYIEQIATTLVCVALFDREVNLVFRAASAAFQEIVGRQGTFPNGIEILTKIDYFAVGQRCRTYLEISCQIARYSMYTQGIIEHLISFKVSFVLKKLIPLISNESLIMRQGGVVALAFTLSGLKRCGTLLHEELYENVTQIPSMVYPLCKKRTNSLGSKLMRRAMNVFIKSLSSVILLNSLTGLLSDFDFVNFLLRNICFMLLVLFISFCNLKCFSLINSLDDYTMDKRGDIGRVLREEAMRALAIILPLAQNYSKIVDRISEAVCKIIQQSIEKIDATREVVLPEYAIFAAYVAIFMLKKISQSPSCFKRLALLLKSSYYRYSALSGFIISAGKYLN
ncbi:unnamed protein product [Brugia pahangi]|uniref:Tubulin-specific chaperone D n=1 Tax=Brugia pahangi TaxID=6280 RepID=A0A0N4SZA1_BRUPA|nr:unnamed protein product [Brugia pahangi]